MERYPMMRINAKVRNFLFGMFNKEFLIFLLFLVISALFWLGMTLNETYEREYMVTMAMDKVPKNAVITKSIDDTVLVTIRDRGFLHTAYTYSDRLKKVKVNFLTYANKKVGKGVVSQVELQKIIYKRLYGSSKVVSVKPDKMDFTFNYGLSKKVPVRLMGSIVPAKSYYLARTRFWPDSVLVYATQAKLDSIKYVTTEDINIENFEDTVVRNVSLSKVDEVKIVPATVKIALYPDILTEGSIEVPITAINMPAGMVLRTFPSKVKVKFIVGVSMFKKIRPEQFLVVADYKELMKRPSDKCNIYLRTSPHGTAKAQLEIRQVDYLIER
ncbi:MAG: YbbR-like domain-containing protein [Prevotella sp.]|nr:YbbR-like domain-containing protein [Prevotella sp.]